jgi:hypothetical protein
MFLSFHFMINQKRKDQKIWEQIENLLDYRSTADTLQNLSPIFLNEPWNDHYCRSRDCWHGASSITILQDFAPVALSEKLPLWLSICHVTLLKAQLWSNYLASLSHWSAKLLQRCDSFRCSRYWSSLVAASKWLRKKKNLLIGAKWWRLGITTLQRPCLITYSVSRTVMWYGTSTLTSGYPYGKFEGGKVRFGSLGRVLLHPDAAHCTWHASCIKLNKKRMRNACSVTTLPSSIDRVWYKQMMITLTRGEVHVFCTRGNHFQKYYKNRNVHLKKNTK